LCWRLAIAKPGDVCGLVVRGNVKAIVTAIYNAMQAAGYPANALNPWYFPSIGEYGTLLEKQGFQLTFAIF